VPLEESVALAWGNRVHEALEKHINEAVPLPEELGHYAHLYQFPPGYRVLAEIKLGILHDGRACDFWEPECFARGVIDVVVFPPNKPDMAIIIDHKTGKVREQPEELEFHAVLLQAHHPLLRQIKGWYNWLQVGRMGSVHDLSDVRASFNRLQRLQHRLEQCFTLGPDAFPPRQGPLCGWCPVKACEFHP
jgi:hypothetical protein